MAGRKNFAMATTRNFMMLFMVVTLDYQNIGKDIFFASFMFVPNCTVIPKWSRLFVTKNVHKKCSVEQNYVALVHHKEKHHHMPGYLN